MSGRRKRRRGSELRYSRPAARQRMHSTPTMRPLARSLLDFLLVQRSPLRVGAIREQMALSSSEFAVAFRELEKNGLARSLRQVSGDGPFALNQHLFIEATPTAIAESPL